MNRYEYKVIPAPLRGLKGKGVKGNDGKFANALETVMNDMGADGWEYQRAETLPSEERAGLTGKTSVFRNVLVFRRALEDTAPEEEIKLLDAPEAEPEPEEQEEPVSEDVADNSPAHEPTEDHPEPTEEERT